MSNIAQLARHHRRPCLLLVMTKYVGIADLGDEMTATVSIDDIDGYSWRGNIQSGEGHHRSRSAPSASCCATVNTRGSRPTHSFGLDASGDLHFFGEHPFQVDDPER